ncbi:PEGA domain-containing protein [Rhodoplanes sp. TEM]|uniref:PEGA domain-containing protein n=1 Tax=Rhodoplanes tepidamans TaxID=200616 RepID=A0ABT5J450_RHOTP|nr:MULTISPECIES: PEGA domain-containing protein [Rhodoplanes]MDC7784426.1 PEGA domain-containing protein [Rhodoplanes tepidamans]MDC7983456.1 PEGA domain-containing protein [Rhodoplanes sp. TEM]MDQ0356933.1 hypothetical protein [Rhodoplanes tepidamans]
MSRVLSVVVFGSLALSGLAGCSSSSGTSDLPGLGSVFAPKAATLAVTSDPPGAEARLSPTSSCRTPCALTFDKPGEFSVEVSREGHVTQTVPVRVSAPDSGFSLPGTGPGLRVEPATLAVGLEPVRPAAGRGSRSPRADGRAGRG